MSAGAKGARRRRWPLLLISVLLVLLALGTVVTAQLYRSGLRTGLEQMRASVAAAAQEQRRLMARVQAAEAALAERAAALAAAAEEEPSADPAKAPNGAAGGGPGRAPQGLSAGLRRSLSRVERVELAARLAALARDAARLPPSRTRRPPGAPAASKQLLRDQLDVAAAAAAADDVLLLDAALVAAQRLAAAPHRTPDRPGAVLAAELAALRARLRSARPSLPARTEPRVQAPPRAAPAR
ncbi:hypothetical protein [Thiohalocapsa halophila]